MPAPIIPDATRVPVQRVAEPDGPTLRPAQTGADFRELLGILSRRKASILLVTLLAVALGLGYVLTTPKTYSATVSILVDGRARSPIGVEPTSPNTSSPDTALIESQVRLISSDAILRRVVERERLADEPAYGSFTPGLLTRLTGGSVTPVASQADRAARALASLRRSIVAKRSERTYVVDVEMSAADGTTAARLSNAVASAYIADQADAKSQATRRDGEVLNMRLADLQRRLSEAEVKVQVYKQQHQIYDANGKRINEQELADGTTALSAARAKTVEAKARLDQIQRIIASGKSVDAVTEALKSPAIDRLRGQYTEIARQEANYRTTLGDRHPALIETINQGRQVKALINEELKRVAAGAANDYQSARQAEANMEQQVGGLKKTANVTSQASVELRELEHDVDASKAVYDKFLRARETVGEAGLDGPLARVIAPAIAPNAAAAPKTTSILGLALVSGLFVGAGQAFFREYLAQGAPSPPRIPAPAPALPIAAKPPRWRLWARSNGKVAPAPPTVAHTTSRVKAMPVSDAKLDAIASLWLELLAEAPRAGRKTPLTVLVTSSQRDSGKGAAAIDLATAAQASGENVLLMAADRFSPNLAEQLELTGLPQLIGFGGTVRPCYQLLGQEAGNISVIPLNRDEDAVVRRLMRDQDESEIEDASRHFTCVILDGGVIGADDDLADVATAADFVVLVTSAARLSRAQIREAMTAIGLDETRFGGAVCSSMAASAAA